MSSVILELKKSHGERGICIVFTKCQGLNSIEVHVYNSGFILGSSRQTSDLLEEITN